MRFSKSSLRAPLTAVDRYGNGLEKGKGALLLRRLHPVTSPPGPPFLRCIPNRSVPCRRSSFSPSDFPDLSPSVFAKLPYALEETLRPPCRLRSFILLGADNLGNEISPLPFSIGLLSAATSQSPELGDGFISVRLPLASVRPFFTSCRDRRC